MRVQGLVFRVQGPKYLVEEKVAYLRKTPRRSVHQSCVPRRRISLSKIDAGPERDEPDDPGVNDLGFRV